MGYLKTALLHTFFNYIEKNLAKWRCPISVIPRKTDRHRRAKAVCGGDASTGFLSSAVDFSLLPLCHKHLDTSRTFEVTHFFFQPNILNAKITPGHRLCWWVQRSLMTFYPMAFPFLLAFNLLSGEVVTHPCTRDCHIWICQYGSCLFLFLMTSTCLTLTEGLFPGSVLTSKSLSRRRCELHPFSWGRKELDS